MKFRKKPAVIEAVRFDGTNSLEVLSFVGAKVLTGNTAGVYIKPPGTFESDSEMFVSIGDWIIKGVQGEFYLCKPDVFEATYERVDG